jgi:hypothetical protein
MHIASAASTAASAAPPLLAFPPLRQLAMLVHEPAPLLALRPAACISDLALPPLPPALVNEQLFPRWADAGRPLTLPAVVLAGEMAPLPFVLSRPAGAMVSQPQLLTSNAEIAILPQLDGARYLLSHRLSVMMRYRQAALSSGRRSNSRGMWCWTAQVWLPGAMTSVISSVA